MNELVTKPEYMHEVDGKWYMDGRHVAEIIAKPFHKMIRDLKTIVLMEREPDMIRHRDHSDSIDIFSVSGLICTKDYRGFTKDILINEHYCRLIQMYGDFRAVIRLNAEWEAMRKWIDERKNIPVEQLPHQPTLRDKMDCAQLIMAALPNLSEDSKQVMLADLAAEAGMYLPAPVVSDPHKSTTQVAKMLGITPQKLGRLANIYGLKTPDYGEYRLTKAAHCNKHVEQWWWNNAGVERLENLLGGAE
ncbi:hypothetical protein [Escherichia coli]|uniref:hypothetical protein n=1 Tax=Escherichia coli TaxID=562 RepID=UPI0028793A2D|nr:hypothetical protein [Escherichia coli]MDS1650737.1 hypothetical protein [Escherichia coli]